MAEHGGKPLSAASRHEPEHSVVALEVPADPAYLSVIRTTTSSIAAQLDLTVDEIEDLRIAVDEACSLVLDQRAHPGNLQASFTTSPIALDIAVTGPLDRLPDQKVHSWALLRALVHSVEVGPITPAQVAAQPVEPEPRLGIRLTHHLRSAS